MHGTDLRFDVAAAARELKDRVLLEHTEGLHERGHPAALPPHRHVLPQESPPFKRQIATVLLYGQRLASASAAAAAATFRRR